jgi:hypothetical protein
MARRAIQRTSPNEKPGLREAGRFALDLIAADQGTCFSIFGASGLDTRTSALTGAAIFAPLVATEWFEKLRKSK